MQRHVVLGRQPQRDDAEGRSRVAVRTTPGAADALSLAKYRLASRWQPLIRFWQSALTAAVVLVFVLEILGPPERSAGSTPDVTQSLERMQAALPAPLADKPAETGRLPAASTPRRPEPDQPAPPAPVGQPPDGAAQPDVAPPGVSLVLHPARAEGASVIASRLAAQSGLTPDQVDIGTVADTRPDAVIRFYAVGDHSLARRLGKELARMGYSWRIENFAARPGTWKDQAVEIFLPDK